MLALTCPNRPPYFSGEIDCFTESFNTVDKAIILPMSEHPGSDGTDWLEDLDTLVKMASFAARNQTGDPSLLWEKTSRVAQSIQSILEDPRAELTFKRKELVRLRKLYHELAVAVSIFSICGDQVLHEVLYGKN